MFCCRAVRAATVSFVFVKGTGNPNAHRSVGSVGDCPGDKMKPKLLPTPEKFADVIPDPCNAASTSLSDVFKSDWTKTPNSAWSGCKFAEREAVTVIELESSWANASEADRTNKNGALFDIIAVYRSLFEGS
jgi:hypothetical protein